VQHGEVGRLVATHDPRCVLATIWRTHRNALGAVDDVRLPAGSVDLAIMVDVYHELAFPYEVMASVMQALKPGGRVVFVEYKAEDAQVPIKRLHKMSEAQIRREAAVFALDWERTVSTLPWQHVVVFRKRR
jgi:predicted methyltransferase